jgi:hypothetical protein
MLQGIVRLLTLLVEKDDRDTMLRRWEVVVLRHLKLLLTSTWLRYIPVVPYNNPS